MFQPSIFSAIPRTPATAAAFAGAFLLSVHIVGDPKEFKHLLRNYMTYRKEFKMYREELFYS